MLKLMLARKTLSGERKDCLGPDEVPTVVGGSAVPAGRYRGLSSSP